MAHSQGQAAGLVLSPDTGAIVLEPAAHGGTVTVPIGAPLHWGTSLAPGSPVALGPRLARGWGAPVSWLPTAPGPVSSSPLTRAPTWTPHSILLRLRGPYARIHGYTLDVLIIKLTSPVGSLAPVVEDPPGAPHAASIIPRLLGLWGPGGLMGVPGVPHSAVMMLGVHVTVLAIVLPPVLVVSRVGGSVVDRA